MGSTPKKHEEDRQRLNRLEEDERRLWRLALMFLALLATGMAAASWQNFTTLAEHFQAIPLGTVLVGAAFAIYAWTKQKQIVELRALEQAKRETEKTPASEQQLTRLLEAISHSQKNYRELIDSLSDIVVGLTLDGVIHATNKPFCELMGKPFNELVGHNIEEFVVEPTRADADRALKKLIEKRQWTGVARVRLRGENTHRFFECVLYPIVKEGEVAGATLVAQDITHERERESRFTELFETLQEGVYFTTPEGRMLDCNQALVRMLGYSSKEELLAVPVQEHYCDGGERAGNLRHLERSAAVRHRELKLRRKDGRMLVCLDTARAIFDTSGQAIRFQGALIDITERRAMEDKLHDQEEFRRSLVDSFPDLILVLDHEGKYKFVSPRIREVLGYEPETFIGQSMFKDQAPITKELEELFRGLIGGKRVYESAEYSAQHRDGTWRTLRATASPLFDAQGKPAGVVASVRDVTTQKQMEQQLIQSERLAAMGQMIDGFAHELNNPLTAILGAVELLESTAPDPAVARRFELLKQQARRAAEVVQNLLFFARPPAPGKAPLNVSDMVQRSLQLHEHSLRLNNIAVDFIPEPSLPNVVGDPHQLMQVFLNLIINAEQAIREIRPRGTLRVRLGRKSDRVWASFQDDGPGITADALPKIFDPFFTTKRPGRGTGLGLSVVMAILKKYDGTIEAQAAPGGGSVFTVMLPAVSKRALMAQVAGARS